MDECKTLVCGAMFAKTVSAGADAVHSDNNFDACDAAHAACAVTKMCGPANRFKVCMSHELCVDGGCVEEATFETSSYKNVVPDARYSNNFAGRGLHSSTFRLNVSAFCGTGVHLGDVLGVCWGF